MSNQKINIVCLPLQDFVFIKRIAVAGTFERNWMCGSGESETKDLQVIYARHSADERAF